MLRYPLQRVVASNALMDRLCSHSWASSSTAAGIPDAGQDSTSLSGPGQGEDKIPQPQLALVEKYLSPDNMSRKQKSKLDKQKVIAEFQRFNGDVGSSEVQAALLTARIRDLAAHCQQHKQDKLSRRGLQGLLNQRRALLSYLRRDNFERYCFALNKLGLKDNYAKQSRYDNFKVGTRLGAPAERRRRYL